MTLFAVSAKTARGVTVFPNRGRKTGHIGQKRQKVASGTLFWTFLVCW